MVCVLFCFTHNNIVVLVTIYIKYCYHTKKIINVNCVFIIMKCNNINNYSINYLTCCCGTNVLCKKII